MGSHSGGARRGLSLFDADSLLRTNPRVKEVFGSTPEPLAAIVRVLYKLVGVVAPNVAFNLLHPETEYKLGVAYQQIEAVEHCGGLLGFATQADAVLREERKVLAAAQGVHVAVAKFRAWNLDRNAMPRKHGPKLAYDYARIVELLAVPDSLADLVAEANGTRRPPPPLPPPLITASPKPRASAPPAPAMTVAEHATHALAESIETQRQRLRASAGLGVVAVDAAARTPTAAVSPQLLGRHARAGATTGVPPPTAAAQYMVVGVTRHGQARSLRCDDAVYELMCAYRQAGIALEQGALHGFATPHAAASHEPPEVLQGCRLPLAVAELRAWNMGKSVRSPQPPPPPSKRVAYEFVRIERLEPLPEDVASELPAALVWRPPG